MLALALAASAPTLAGSEETAEATPGLEWEFWHDQLVACHRADRIAAQCAHGTCDKEALARAHGGARHSATAFEGCLVSAVPYLCTGSGLRRSRACEFDSARVVTARTG